MKTVAAFTLTCFLHVSYYSESSSNRSIGLTSGIDRKKIEERKRLPSQVPTIQRRPIQSYRVTRNIA